MQTSYGELKGWDRRGFGLCPAHLSAYYRKELLRALGTNKNPLCILEIGFGAGEFMAWARSCGHEVDGIEIEEHQLEEARKAGFRVAASLSDMRLQRPERLYDLVVAFDVLEHVGRDEMRQFLYHCMSVVRPGGKLLFRVPNGDSPFGLLNQNGDITNQCAIGSGFIRQVARACGANVLYIKNPVVPLLHIGLARGAYNLLTLAVRRSFEAPLQVMYNCYFPGVPRWWPLDPNLVFVLSPAGAASTID